MIYICSDIGHILHMYSAYKCVLLPVSYVFPHVGSPRRGGGVSKSFCNLFVLFFNLVFCLLKIFNLYTEAIKLCQI